MSMMLSEEGVSPKKVHFITDPQGFPSMAGQLQHGAVAMRRFSPSPTSPQRRRNTATRWWLTSIRSVS